jgi:CBS domain containing-hemolysin-like protein
VINLISPEEHENGEEAADENRETPPTPAEVLGRTMARQARQELDRLTENTDERRMIHNIIELQDTRVYEIMTPLVDLVAVPLGRMDLEGFKLLAHKTGYSRFPVYREKITNLIGYVDVFRVLREANGHHRLEDFLERPYYVPETKRLDDLLQEILRHRVKNVIVVDEYGGCSGWISREDILEEIVGELEDELDEPSRQITETADGVFLVEGRMEIDALNNVLETAFTEDEWETLAGLLLNEMGRIPSVGDEVSIGDWRATVVAMTGHRIDKVRLIRMRE